MRLAPARRPVVVSIAAILIVSAAAAPRLFAQGRSELRRDASLTVGASVGDGDTALASSIGLGFRFSERVGIELELAHARQLDFTIDHCPAPRLCVLGGQLPVTGRTVSLIPHLTIELLPTSHRLRGYAQAGVGGGHVRQRYFFPPVSANVPDPVELTRSSLTFAVSFGGGIVLQISRRLGLGADVRSLHLLDESATADRFITPSGTLSTLRAGSRVTWRF